jgi:uncharacterized membrane protein
MNSIYEGLAAMGYTHPIHPPMTYLPIGMVIASLIFGLTARWSRHADLAVTARHCVILGLIGAFPTVITGFLDWQYFYGGAWMLPIRMKILLAGVLLFLLCTTVLLHLKLPAESRGILFMYFFSFLTVVVIGYFGGVLVFGTPGAVQDKTEPIQKRIPMVTYAEVAKIFEQRCISCHSGPSPADDLRLDAYEQVMSGGEHGPVVVPGKPDESELMQRIRGEAQPRMPLRQAPLPENEMQTIESWIAQGAQRDFNESSGG